MTTEHLLESIKNMSVLNVVKVKVGGLGKVRKCVQISSLLVLLARLENARGLVPPVLSLKKCSRFETQGGLNVAHYNTHVFTNTDGMPY